MKRLATTIAILICFFWACHNQYNGTPKPITKGITHSHQMEAAHDSALKDLDARISLSEQHLKALRGNLIKRGQSLEIMNPQEPLQHKADNPPQ